MTHDELRALADALSVPHRELATVDVIRAAAYLRAQADVQPVAWRVRTLGQQPGPWRAYWSALRPCVLHPSQCEFESLYARPAPAVPAGYKLVPVEPTPDMLSAVGMMDGYDWHAPGCSPDADHANWYSAMIAAAPAASQAEQPIDLDAVAMQQMRQAAAESTWLPAEYSGNDWINDVCRWLRDGPPQAEPIDPHMIVAEDRFPDVQAEPKRPAFLDEIDRAKEHVASWPQWMKDATVSAAATLPVTEPKREALRGLAPTHRCPACGAFWRQCDDASWNLRSASCCGLCDAGRVELVCWLDEPKREPLSDEPPRGFVRWVRNNMPPNTVISNPDWWAMQLWRAAMRAHRIGGSDAE